MKRNLQQNKILHALIGTLGIPADVKEELVHQFTNGRETKSSEMTVEECRALINHLNVIKQQNIKVVASPGPVFQNTPANNMRRKVISIAHEMKWKLPNGKADMTRVNDFCVKRGHAHKTLNEYTYDELPKLITQFEQVLREYYAKG